MKQTNLQANLRKKFTKQGVKMIAPDTVFFSKDTKIGKNVLIDPYVVIGKKVKIQNNVKNFFFLTFRKCEDRKRCESWTVRKITTRHNFKIRFKDWKFCGS